MPKTCHTCNQSFPAETRFCPVDGSMLIASPDRDDRDPLIGQTLDNRWEIKQLLGAGSMGSVYLAAQKSVQRTVAIKTLHPTLSRDTSFVQRFFREARVASSLANPHCVTLHDFGQTPKGLLYFAMEYLEGTTLDDRLRESPLSIAEIVTVCLQITVALSAAHDKRVIHRDLKPENIWLLDMPDGSIFVKVLDFGIAKVLDDDVKMTRAGDVYGTPSYMSPEQCLGQDVDARSDMYGLGCVLYEMLAGVPPFESNNIVDIIFAQIRDIPTPVLEAAVRNDIPQQLADLCMELLEKSADDRPANASQVGQELNHILQDRDTNTRIPQRAPHRTLSAPTAEAGRATLPRADAGRTTLWNTLNIPRPEEYNQTNIDSPFPIPILWRVIFTVLGITVGLCMVGSVGAWIAAGSPDFILDPPTVSEELSTSSPNERPAEN